MGAGFKHKVHFFFVVGKYQRFIAVALDFMKGKDVFAAIDPYGMGLRLGS